MNKYTILMMGIMISSLTFYTCKSNPKYSPEFDSLFKITGHRGFAGKYPENTLTAIQKALELKIDRIEVDVHQTKDSVLVVIHDSSINRTTNGKGEIKNYNYKDLMQYSAGSKFNPSYQLEKIPTLKEVLDLVNGNTHLLIEIKSGSEFYPNIEKNVTQLIEKYKAENWCLIQSFEDDILERVHQLNPKIKLHKLLLSALFYDLDNMEYIDEYSIYHYAISKRLINEIHHKGKKINAWTVNEKEKIRKLINIGIDGIITDYPDIALQLRSL